MGGILEEEKAFLVPREKEALSEAVAQLGVCNPEVTHFKWPLCVSLPWGRLGVQKPSLCSLASPCSTPLPHYPRLSPLRSATPTPTPPWACEMFLHSLLPAISL